MGRMGRAAAIAGVVGVLLAGCGGGDGRGDDGLKGTYSAPDVGSIELDGEGGATISIGDDRDDAPATYERVDEEDHDLIIVDGGSQAEALLDGDAITFLPGTYGFDDEITLTRE